MNVLCRGCRTEIDLNAGTCPICLRPRDRSEMLEDAKRLREAQAEAKARPYKILGAALALGVLGYAGWRWREPVLGAVDALRSKAGAAMDKAGDPKTYAPSAGAPSDPAAPPPPSGPAPAPPAGSSPPTARTQAGAPSAPAPAPAPTVEPPVDWDAPRPTLPAMEGSVILYGWVYDLVTARPLPGATIRLRDRLSGAVMAVNADHRGWYELAVSRESSGFAPEAAVPGYRRETLAENEPAWHARKAAARRRAAAEEPAEVLITFGPRQEEAQVNIVLLPQPR